MSLPHFFLDNQVIAHEALGAFALRLAPDDVKHARALRLSPGEHIAVVDAAKDYFECEVVALDQDALSVRIAQKFDADRTLSAVVLVQGIAKGDKMDDIIRHATEIGVSGFVPFSCERSIVKLDEKKAAARTQRWRSIAKSAAMQSGQRDVPEVSLPLSLGEVCDLVRNAHAVLVCWEEASTGSIREALTGALGAQGVLPEDARVVVVVGPEGGLTEHEAARLTAANRFASTVSLGPSILRTETAGLVAPALVLYELGGLQ
ncbi:RsmE family RNA methyltransferase [Raoultibacter phocaeensis]|uniref:RsmE family RNA methyltransferase n=1 Tax=Raoultibacter phocaeensis TaxID=2479841 RepID=UPI00111AA6CD|nr:16S rRNA (uracil(1498)-N(3))-methyltransferase [Raoultibacter phocaeensis]